LPATSRLTKTAFGHAGSMVEGEFFYKLKPKAEDRFRNELSLLSSLAENARLEEGAHDADPILPYAPRFHGLVEMAGRSYFKMQHLLGGFDEDAHIMDIKMGVRCHAEDEGANVGLRRDLFDRMMKMEASLLTEAEQQAQGITKLRWMTLRDTLSSTKTLGFRIDALETATDKMTAFESDLFRTREEEQTILLLRRFVPTRSQCLDCRPGAIASDILRRLEHIDAGLRRSPLFSKHEFIGSTLLFVADKHGRSGVWMIDFGVTIEHEEALRHDIDWEPGNREDGYLIGLASLIRQWRRLVAEDVWE